MTVRQAVVDDTERLWISFADGRWLWVDLAGFLEDHRAIYPPPFLALQDGLDLWLTPDINLPLPLLFWPREQALEHGVYVCAASRSFIAWYRPLCLTRGVSLIQIDRPVQWLERLLRVSPEEIQQAASTHGVGMPVFSRRLADLCLVLQEAGWSAREILKSPQALLKHDGALTLWHIIVQGKIGLAEQLATAKANRPATHKDLYY
ncbi:hypothetical protein [Deinococcus sp. PEB2-67]